MAELTPALALVLLLVLLAEFVNGWTDAPRHSHNRKTEDVRATCWPSRLTS